MASNEARYAENFNKLVSQGVGADWLQQKTGGAVENKSRNSLLSEWQGSNANPAVGIPKALSNLASQEYQFDPMKYLPGIQQQADAIYSPQQAQLEAIRLLQGSQYEDQAITTNKEFDDTLRGEIESINNRGSYFSGGAIEREQDINDSKLRALNQLGLQAQAADFSNLAQQGILAAEEAQFIQDRLYNAESGAYARWTDQRNFSYQTLLSQYEVYTTERNFARSVFEADRSYKLQKEQVEMQQEQFEKNYSITKQELEMSKEKFNIDIQSSQLQLDKALADFKKTTAVTNSGVFGVDEGGNDVLDSYRSTWENYNQSKSNSSPGYQNDGGVFDIDSWLNK